MVGLVHQNLVLVVRYFVAVVMKGEQGLREDRDCGRRPWSSLMSRYLTIDSNSMCYRGRVRFEVFREGTVVGFGSARMRVTSVMVVRWNSATIAGRYREML